MLLKFTKNRLILKAFSLNLVSLNLFTSLTFIKYLYSISILVV